MKLRNLFYSLLTGVLAFATASCEDNANDWPLDPSHDRLFSTTAFAEEELLPTSVLVTFNGVKDATKYVFEISRGDSLLFNNIVVTEEVKADTLTPVTESTNIVNTEFQKWFNDLDGTTRYSIRVKAVNENNGVESKFVGLCFDTPAEQIFTNVIPGITMATLNWQSDKDATRIAYGTLVSADVDAGIPADTLWVGEHSITASEQAAGECVVSNLTSGTNYIAQIFREDVLRGTYRFKTLGASSGTPIKVQPGDDLNALLAGATGDVTLEFTAGDTHTLKKLTVPAGIDNLYLSGNVVNGKLPKLILANFGFDAPMNNFAIQYMEVVSDESAAFMIEFNNENTPKHLAFEGCNISLIPRSLVRPNNANAPLTSIRITNCILRDIGLSGYGLLNVGKGNNLKEISITRSTLWNIGDQVIDLRVVLDEFTFELNTFYNSVSMGKIFRLDKQPKNVTMTTSIWSGPFGGAKVNSGNGDYSKWLSYAGCYQTADVKINSRPFYDAVVLGITSDELYVNPAEGDFHFKPGLKFEGDGVAGDPRWWTE